MRGAGRQVVTQCSLFSMFYSLGPLSSYHFVFALSLSLPLSLSISDFVFVVMFVSVMSCQGSTHVLSFLESFMRNHPTVSTG